MRTADECAGHRSDHLQCNGRGRWQRRRLLQGSRLRRLAGLVPRQISTGDRTILGKISKRGNRYLRVLFVQAAWVVLIKPKSWQRHGLKSWIEAAKKRLHHNVLAIALANKLARIAWSVLARGRVFETSKLQTA
jgi:transposase